MPGSVTFAKAYNEEISDMENFQTINSFAVAPQTAINDKKSIVSGENSVDDFNSISNINNIGNISSEDSSNPQENISEKTPNDLAAVFLALDQWWGALKYIFLFLFLAGMVWLFLFRKKKST